MNRRLLNAATLLSLLLCAISLAGWALSYHGPLSDPYGRTFGARRVALDRGVLWLNHSLPDPHLSGPPLVRDWGWNFLDAVVYRHFQGRREEWTMFGLRLLPVAGAASALPLLRLGAAVLRRRRRVPGTCAGCGYDLRATPGRCPECGRMPVPDGAPPDGTTGGAT